MPRSRAHKASTYKPSRGRLAGRTFKTERAYRDALARTKGFKNAKAASRARRSSAAPRKLSALAQHKRNDALEVLNLMRRGGLDLKAAVKGFNAYHPDSRTTGPTVTKYIKSALRQKKGQWLAKSSDRLVRVMRFATPEGTVDLEVRGSRAASRIGEYWNAVGHYGATGDESQLKRFQGKYIRAGKRRYYFLTDTSALERQAEAGEFRFDSIYEASAGG